VSSKLLFLVNFPLTLKCIATLPQSHHWLLILFSLYHYTLERYKTKDEQTRHHVIKKIDGSALKLSIPLPDGAAAGATVSIGVNTQTPARDISWDSFISAADNALYKTKEIGRNRVCVVEGQTA